MDILTTKHGLLRSFALILVSLIMSVVSVLLPLGNTVFAEAKVASIANYQTTATQRSLAEGLTECLTDGRSGLMGSVDELISGNKTFFLGNSAPFVGPLADSKDGRLSCDEILQSVRSEFKYGTIYELVCDLGGSTLCQGKTGEDSIHLTGRPSGVVISTLENKLGKKLPRNNDTLDYALAFGSLVAGGYGCNGQLRLNLSDVDKKRSDNHAITVAMTDGTTQEVYMYIPQARQDDNIQMFAQGFTRWAGTPKLKCTDLVNWASKNASAFAASIKQDVVAETQARVREALMTMCTNNSSGSTVTEYCNTQVNNWLSACRAQIPSSGNVADSNSFVTCISNESAIGADVVKSALSGVSVVEPTEATTENSSEGAVACAISGVGWIVCPVVNFLASVADVAFDFLADNFLSVPPSLMDTRSGTFTAWKTFVAFANAAFVVVFLIMIFSQITGGGLSNYNMKKVLPRLIIGAVLVNLSFYLCTIIIDISNILGYGLKELLSTAAGSATNSVATTWDQTGSGFAGIAGTVLAAGAGAGVAVAASGGVTLALVALLGVLLSGVVALIMIFLILMIRQVLIVLLVVVAPLAFVANILPNTEGLFKKWKSLFTSMLLLFPIVGLIYGASSLASSVISGSYAQASDDTGMLPSIIAAGVMVLPLFVVPSVLKKSLDVVGGLGGKISGLSGKVGGGLKGKVKNSGFNKYAEGLSQERRSKIGTGAYRGKLGKFNPNNWRSSLNRRANTSGVFNAITSGYGAQRDLQVQAQNRKDMQETMAMFNNNDNLAKAWAMEGGEELTDSKAKFYGLNDADKQQYQKMRSAGQHKNQSSFIAATKLLSEGGKGSSSAIIQALQNAAAAGASDIDINTAWGDSTVAYRKSGRADILGEMNAHFKKNGDSAPIGPGAQLENNANTIADAREAAWSTIDAGTVHREALSSAGGKMSYQKHLEASEDNLTSALRGYDRMEARAQGEAHNLIIAAAQSRNVTKHPGSPAITSMEDAKKIFLAN